MASDTAEGSLEERISRIEEKEAVWRTIQKYNRAYDSQDRELLRSIFAEDAVADVSPWGVFEGIDDIVALYDDIWQDMPFLNHHTTNQVIEVDGEEAVATSYYHVMIEDADENPMKCGGFYERHLEKRDGEWVHTRHIVEIEYLHQIDAPSFRKVDGFEEPRPRPQDNPYYPLPLFPEKE